MFNFLSNTTNLIAKFSVLFGLLFLATFLYANSAVAASADFVDNLIEDMGDNEATLMNAPPTDWSQHAYLDMGFAARGDATPQSWASAQGGQYTSSEPWQTILPWFQIWPVEGNSGVSTVQVSNIQAQVLVGGSWQTLELEPEQWAQLDSWDLIGGKGGVDSEEVEEGVYQYVIDNSGPVHGGLGRHLLSDLGVDPSSIEGVAISAVAEIVEGSGEILFEIGGDYHPNMEVQVSDFALQWGPAIGGSKFGIIDGARCIYMTTIDPPGQGDGSAYASAGGKVALTHDELRANPPQDLCDGAGSSKRPKIEFTAEESGFGGNSVELTWDVKNADTCEAVEGTADWSGEVETSGSQIVEDFARDTRFGLVCEGNGFKTRKSVSVSAHGEIIDGEDEGGGDEETSDDSGSGSHDSDDDPGSGSDSDDSGSEGSFSQEARENMVRILNLLVEKLLQLLDLYQKLLGFGGESDSSGAFGSSSSGSSSSGSSSSGSSSSGGSSSSSGGSSGGSSSSGGGSTASGDWWVPDPNSTWQYDLGGSVDTSKDVDVSFIDLFYNDKSVFDELHANGQKVGCYISAGSYENGRPDAHLFPESTLGNVVDNWPNERWLDIRQIDALAPALDGRLDLAVEKGCDGIDPDIIHGHENDTGFPLTFEDQIRFNTWLANEAHERGLGIGLKNDISQTAELVDVYDWTLNEMCHQFNECDTLQPFTDAGKAVFVIEYNQSTGSFCPSANANGYMAMNNNGWLLGGEHDVCW